MKTWKDVRFDTMFTVEQALLAARRASEGKRRRTVVQQYLSNKNLVEKLVDELHDGTYRPQPTLPHRIYDHKSAKWRTIVMPAFRDQIVHWMIMLVLQEYMCKTFIHHTVAAIPGRGPSLAHKSMRHWAKAHKTETRWVVQADVKQFYASIDHDLLMAMLARRIRDRRVLAVIRLIVDQCEKGLPLGFYLSQWLANFYLCAFDHHVKERLGVKQYVRYVDDMVFAVRTKSDAIKVVESVKNELSKLRLRIKESGQGALRVFRWANVGCVDFVGVRTHRDGFQELRKKTYLAIRRLMARIEKKQGASISQARSLLSRRGFVLHTDSRTFLAEMERIIRRYRLKRMVSNYAKHNAA